MEYAYQHIIDKFIDSFKNKHANDNINVTGILVFGSSLSYKELPQRSDIDLYLVIENNGKRYRGISVIDGIEVDYFVNPIEQLKLDYENTKKAPKKTVLFMLANGKILRDSNKELESFQSEARDFLQSISKNDMPSFMITFTKYFIEDYLKDIYDNLEDQNDFALHYNIDLLCTYLLETICQIHHLTIEKPKYLTKKINDKDPQFVEIYEKVKNAKNNHDAVEQIAQLSEYVLEKLGGKLPNEWEIESPFNI